ncbi:hypothetical protein CHLRE_13g576466v5 [Chlamydomonas reinhardtii]|uniref:Uncharacterized protein n=1 Tax=Chlamydomonas reinhardtii TaxID=3055 RepID=A8HT97_CHLRE|nr:uncharacterized protein CHLRE_13g576466v5 [Chlamydomonas reinhardtii]PNW73876.1 hypothetical protein CHLRE_13g576466v5 [Chlamydomonas reinhardtii]|eukprot:XP_001693533.1 predicted protein [Chlamydomonas reinhardtii]
MADFDDLSLGEQLAHFGGDVDAFTDYHNGVHDENYQPYEQPEEEAAPDVEDAPEAEEEGNEETE